MRKFLVRMRSLVLYAIAIGVSYPSVAHATGDAESETFARGLLSLAVVLLAAKVGALVHRLRQPMVLGEILAGVALGNLALVGIAGSDALRSDSMIRFLSQLGAVILLFQIGLESNLLALRRIGGRAAGVALIGVAVPFLLGAFVAGPLLFPETSRDAHLFLGAALTATSIGITGRVFRDAAVIDSPEARIVLGAAVIDDVLGLLILGVVSSLAVSGAVDGFSTAITIVQAFGFLVAAFFVGRLMVEPLSDLFAAIDRGAGMKFSVALAICFAFAAGAHSIGLAPIVGAFAAGLALEPVHFKAFEGPAMHRELFRAAETADHETRARIESLAGRWTERHLDEMIEPVAHLLVPIFFVTAGLQIRLDHLANPHVLAAAGALTVIAIAGKLASGIAAGEGRRWLVGWGMVPRGEVGLIFAFVGHSLGVIDEELLSIVVLVVLLTTLVTPPVLAHLVSKQRMPAASDPRGESDCVGATRECNPPSPRAAGDSSRSRKPVSS